MKQVQTAINKIKQEVFVSTSIITIVIILLLLLLPFFEAYSTKGITLYSGYSSLFFLNDRLDYLYYGAVFLLFHDIFALLILIMSLSCLFIQKQNTVRRFKVVILILHFVLGILLIISSLFAKNTNNWIKIRFGYNLITIFEFTFSSALLFLLLKELYINKVRDLK